MQEYDIDYRTVILTALIIFPYKANLFLLSAAVANFKLFPFPKGTFKLPQRIDVIRTIASHSAPRPHKKIINDKKSFQLKNMQTWRLIYHFYCAVAWALAYEGVITYTALYTLHAVAYTIYLTSIYTNEWV